MGETEHRFDGGDSTKHSDSEIFVELIVSRVYMQNVARPKFVAGGILLAYQRFCEPLDKYSEF